jgi:hypothetical protein
MRIYRRRGMAVEKELGENIGHSHIFGNGKKEGNNEAGEHCNRWPPG